MRTWPFVLLTLGGLLAPGALDAQRSEGGRYELGAFTMYSRFDPTRLQLSRDYGVGLRAAVHLSRALAVEAVASRTPTRHGALGVGVVATELGATALASIPAGDYNRLYGGIGYSWLSYSRAASRDHALHALVGDRFPLSRMSALRVEAKAVYTPSSKAFAGSGSRAVSFGVSVGLSFFASERPPRDSDGDVVSDRFDACPATPAAAAVDARGCPRDGDADGVFDGLDRCPATRGLPAVDSVGCALDGDGDGIADHLDRCPGTASGQAVESDGCGDADGDGVLDDADRCALTPGGTPVDGSGCPRDSDSDGVADYLDRCPATPESQRVDEIGCTVLFQEEEGQRVPLVLRGVSFDLGQATLTPGSFAALDEVAASLVANPEVRVEVGGHTDDSGTDEFNLRLSVERAEAVRGYLISRGVTPDRLEARGYGTQEPIASNDTEQGRAQNRRVELRLIDR
jgi:outer membrane protein OmpA-like peptidoglycan-associated protein